MTQIDVPSVRARVLPALPFWLSLALVPLAWWIATVGGWWVLLLPLSTWYLFSLLDALTGLNVSNADPTTEEAELFWYRAITLIWTPVQAATIFGILWYATQTDHLSPVTEWGLFAGLGILSGKKAEAIAAEMGLAASTIVTYRRRAYEKLAYLFF